MNFLNFQIILGGAAQTPEDRTRQPHMPTPRMVTISKIQNSVGVSSRGNHATQGKPTTRGGTGWAAPRERAAPVGIPAFTSTPRPSLALKFFKFFNRGDAGGDCSFLEVPRRGKPEHF